MLVHEFEHLKPKMSFDQKLEALESDTSLTRVDLLSYQTKLYQLNSMKSLNSLKKGKHLHIYLEFFTLGFTPFIKNEKGFVS